ncbi:IS66 family insertion sequence element accessory protein TnpB [uncultured Sphaerochaeta sp.]|jgi:transposase|uniref:IS66 family insertion sequence element accessory protein TnpB n=1 Tax=uncultured Sphaerochaeta sp. TaxID=886478 RepID=UPI002A0A7452|nr:IS66 family insertion sequence element accessory protein TnpB [uncultured Sphaerochaeta sp.]
MLDMSGIPIYLLPGYSDLRRGINGFVSVITNIMEMDVTLGGLYIFCGRRRDSIKCVMWDKTGFLLLQKKLVGGYTFAWPNSEERVKEISGEDLLAMLDGIDIFRRFTPWENVRMRPGKAV